MMTFKEHAQLDEALVNPLTVVALVIGGRKILKAGKAGYRYFTSKQTKKVIDKVFQTADDGAFIGPPSKIDVRRLKDVCGPNTIIPKNRLQNMLKQFNIEPDVLGYLLAFLAGVATVLILMLIFTVGKNIKDIVSYVNTKYKGLKGKFKKVATKKDTEFIGNTLKAA